MVHGSSSAAASHNYDARQVKLVLGHKPLSPWCRSATPRSGVRGQGVIPGGAGQET
jgi:hypothetical protein